MEFQRIFGTLCVHILVYGVYEKSMSVFCSDQDNRRDDDEMDTSKDDGKKIAPTEADKITGDDGESDTSKYDSKTTAPTEADKITGDDDKNDTSKDDSKKTAPTETDKITGDDDKMDISEDDGKKTAPTEANKIKGDDNEMDTSKDDSKETALTEADKEKKKEETETDDERTEDNYPLTASSSKSVFAGQTLHSQSSVDEMDIDEGDLEASPSEGKNEEKIDSHSGREAGEYIVVEVVGSGFRHPPAQEVFAGHTFSRIGEEIDIMRKYEFGEKQKSSEDEKSSS